MPSTVNVLVELIANVPPVVKISFLPLLTVILFVTTAEFIVTLFKILTDAAPDPGTILASNQIELFGELSHVDALLQLPVAFERK
jgi:hypothetical protein